MAAKLSRRKCVACGKMNVMTVIWRPVMGYFVGTECSQCKNLQRYSDYVSTSEQAIALFESGAWKS